MTLAIGNDYYTVETVLSWQSKMCACGAWFNSGIPGTYWEKLWDKTHADHNRAYWGQCKAAGCPICNHAYQFRRSEPQA